jgi:hypothetical protein
MTALDNPLIIDRVELDQTLEKKPVVNLYSNPLGFPVLSLFESQFGLLFDVGIDPNALTVGAALYTRFLAQWEAVLDDKGKPKLNQKGNQYKNVVALIPNGTTGQNDTVALLTQIAKSLEEIKALVYQKTTPQPNGAVKPQTAVSQPNGTAKPQPSQPPAKIHADEMLSQMNVTIEEPGQRPTVKPKQTANGKQPAAKTSAVTAVTPAEWLQRAQEATDPFDFDTCIHRAIPFYDSADRVESARMGMFGEWKVGEAAAYVAGIQKYASARDELEANHAPATAAHKEAKSMALVEYRKVIDGTAVA